MESWWSEFKNATTSTLPSKTKHKRILWHNDLVDISWERSPCAQEDLQ